MKHFVMTFYATCKLLISSFHLKTLVHAVLYIQVVRYINLPTPPPPLPLEEYNQLLGEDLVKVYKEIQDTRQTDLDTTLPAHRVSK